jgi:PST family polysaccharide transporter
MLDKLNQLPFFYLIRHKSFQNFVFLFLIQSSNVLISLISMPILIQSIGLDQFGLVNLAFSVVLLFNVLVGFGYNLSGPREIALQQENKREMGAVFSKILCSKLLLALLSLGLIILMGLAGGFFEEYRMILFWSAILLFSEATTTTWFFQGLEKMKLASLANVFSKLMYLFLLVLFIQQPDHSKWANFFLGFTGFVTNFMLILYIHHYLIVRFSFPGLAKIWQSWKENLMLFLSGLASHVAVNGGLIILSFFAAAQVLGLYSLAERIGMVLRIVPTLITQAAYPNASKLFVQDNRRFYLFLRKVQLSSTALCFLITFGIYVGAPQIIYLMSGDRLTSSVIFLRILAFLPLFASLNISNMLIILVTNQKKILFDSTWTFCLYMIISAVLMTYFFGGEGLAFALLSTELFIFVVSALLLRTKSPFVLKKFYGTLFGSLRHT